jgi:hypothetical protein
VCGIGVPVEVGQTDLRPAPAGMHLPARAGHGVAGLDLWTGLPANAPRGEAALSTLRLACGAGVVRATGHDSPDQSLEK